MYMCIIICIYIQVHVQMCMCQAILPQIFIHSLTPHTAGKTPAKKVDNGSPHTECPSAGKHMYTLCACTYVYVE